MAPTRAVLDYWCAIRGEELVPRRANVRPADLLPFLPNLVIVEYKDPGALNYRLAGTAFMKEVGRELTGTDFFEIFEEGKRNAAPIDFDTVRRAPCGLLLREILLTRFQSPSIFEMLFLPMRTHQDEITQLIGLMTKVAPDTFNAVTGEAGLANSPTSLFLDVGAGVPTGHREKIQRAG
ncbi:MAG: PAS domain-containing protein [Alphaproteobacteria bacterium]|nr:PAS domain-containing protein [Alphaproteobacteria bacterium]